MPDVGLEQVLRDLTRDARTWVEVGIVDEVETDPDAGFLATVTLEPIGTQVQCRLFFAGGVLYPFAEGAEVAVFVPNGDYFRAVAVVGLFSGAAPIPSCFDNTTPQIVHPNGLEVRDNEADPVARVVHAPFLQAFGTYLTALEAFMTTSSTATTAPQIAAAAAAFNLAKGTFAANVAASATDGPHSSPALRVTE